MQNQREWGVCKAENGGDSVSAGIGRLRTQSVEISAGGDIGGGGSLPVVGLCRFSVHWNSKLSSVQSSQVFPLGTNLY